MSEHFGAIQLVVAAHDAFGPSAIDWAPGMGVQSGELLSDPGVEVPVAGTEQCLSEVPSITPSLVNAPIWTFWWD